MANFEHLKDVVGQLPFLKTYSHLLLVFPLPSDDEASRQRVRESLYQASQQLTAAFPWLGAKVVERSSSPGKSNSFELEPCGVWSSPKSIIRVKDCTSSSPSYDDIVKERGPAWMFPGALLAPRNAFPESYTATDEDPAPVVAFQANFIHGGLLLDCAAQHNIVDMKGIEQCFNLLATALRNETFTDDAIAHGNLDRRTLIPLLDLDSETMHDHSQFYRPKPDDPVPPPLEPSSRFSWRYFRFSADRLAQLKLRASSSMSDSIPAVSYVSTNDALMAFCWQRVIAARLRRRQTGHAIGKLLRAVDARNTMGVPNGYMGDLVTIATSRLGFQDLVDMPLGDVATLLRRDLLAVNNRDYIRSFATFVASTDDKSQIVYGGKFNPDTDIGSSSWAALGLSKVDFGPLLGKPAMIRRPDFVPLKSDIYLMPMLACGDIDALLCFNDVDFQGLMEDGLWRKYADYIG
ncbi:transferase family-domain-containing protein [Rhypophila decipiens]|uniref:Transferase family-domain-containing protein n=1 Tax=Rhypophila decipiens TaxID=261697 RepID=A0AAN7B8U8_9PEZI|nr:transferase family-domain-containing protein [Rhypophila decipiens]